MGTFGHGRYDELGLNEGLPMKAHHGMVENYDEYNEKLSLKSIQC